MIGWLRGRLLWRDVDGEILLDVGGVGYRVVVPTPVLASVREIGDEIELYVHTHVREDALVLYGFRSLPERRCFEVLLGAYGVGPSLAVAVLGVLGPSELARALAEDDIDALCAVPGIGRKTAARLLLDLKSKVSTAWGVAPEHLGADGGGSEDRRQARAALGELGYGPDEVRQALGHVDPDAAVEDQVRQALRELASAARRTDGLHRPVGAR